ncbi:Y-family DNA polymerase [Legionella spiritensis]|uniref:SOS mutagenesis and repair UmuC protein n=1 Tax=Legionella spiritensis TaxID=452 RepID=A0A0W0Z627_LEGSP|nr:Y-family DNA polymerase [Legionella spiritensis]KTD64319.1 SOS mutagenesis and repair UmuC protein [Legionella spiritensis]SNV46624.1 SOS mutagenesis and repair UmuC protein [Legionella spiritensis]
MYALIDCNNFYASCERLFRPDLRQVPIIVLSSNDGCVIARSNEAKTLGVGMGEPFFKVRALCRQHQIQIFSSNFSLYGDLSSRVMQTIEATWPHVEIYSIDEAFLDLSTLPGKQRHRFCLELHGKLLRHTGIPTSIGIGPTRTLAKIANHIAKKMLQTPVFDVSDSPFFWLDKIPVGEVWGVGRKWSDKLIVMGIKTAGDLARADIALIRQRFSVVMQRTAYELRGLSCLTLDEGEPKKSILSSKSFGNLQTGYDDIAQAISNHTARAWEKMRRQKLTTHYLSVFVRSSPFRSDLPQYANNAGYRLVTPSDDLRHLTHCAKRCLQSIFKEGIYYQKAGVMLEELRPKEPTQADLFHHVSEAHRHKTERLMQIMETINDKFGRHSVRLAAEGHCRPWSLQAQIKSPAYTTRWSELPVVNTGDHVMIARIVTPPWKNT